MVRISSEEYARDPYGDDQSIDLNKNKPGSIPQEMALDPIAAEDLQEVIACLDSNDSRVCPLATPQIDSCPETHLDVIC